MTEFPQHRVPHVRDSFIVANVDIVRSTTAPAHLSEAEISTAAPPNLEVES
jgi:hypothetical protein